MGRDHVAAISIQTAKEQSHSDILEKLKMQTARWMDSRKRPADGSCYSEIPSQEGSPGWRMLNVLTPEEIKNIFEVTVPDQSVR